MQTTTTTTVSEREIVADYLERNGPTEPWRIARDTGLTEAAVVAMARAWRQRSRLEGPGGNYVSAV